MRSLVGLYPLPKLLQKHTEECIDRNDPVGIFLKEACENVTDLHNVTSECLTTTDIMDFVNLELEDKSKRGDKFLTMNAPNFSK